MRYALVALILLIGFFIGGKYILGDIFVDGLPATVLFSGTNRIELQDTIFTYFKHQVGLAPQHVFYREEYEIKSKYLDINNDTKKDIIVVLESDYTCGTEGCLAGIFLRNELDRFEAIKKFSYTVKEIEVLDTFTNGMRDIRITNGEESSTMTWNGATYTVSSI